jgi:hypothetical protein
MKKWIAALSVSLALSTLPLGAFAHGYDAGDAALGGFVGGVVGGLIGSGGVPVYVAPAPVVVAPARPVVVERYAPAPVVVERPVYYRGGDRGWHRGWYKHGWYKHGRHGHHRHHHDRHRRHHD